MRRLGTALAALAAVMAGLTYASAPATSAPADEAIQRLGGCLSSGGQGRILLVLDTSASLADTDPQAARVQAAQYLVRQLASQVDRKDVSIDVAVAGFADAFKVYRSWTPLDSRSESAISSTVGEFRDRNGGFETDYWAAASGARAYLADEAKGEQRTCQAWVWFSDGLYDLDKRDTASERDEYGLTKPYGPDVELTSAEAVARIENAGREDLCRQGGVADQLRVQGVTTFAVGLSSAGVDDYSLMEGLATGSRVQGSPCGRTNGPTRGTFVEAANIEELFFALDAVTDAPIVQETALCQGQVCPEGTHQFVLDPSITSVHILAGTDLSGYRVELLAPTPGQRLALDPGDAPVDKRFPDFNVRSQWTSDKQVQIDLQQTGVSGWAGRWQLVFVDPQRRDHGTARSNIHLYGDVKPGWLDADSAELTVGESTGVQLGLVQGGDDKPLDLTTLRSSVLMDASLEYTDGTSIPLASGLTKAELVKPVDVALTNAGPGPAVVHLTLHLTTAPVEIAGGRTIPGTALEPESMDYPVTVSPPPHFPVVPSTVSFGETQAEGDLSASLPIKGDGCVWLQKSEALTVPEQVTTKVSSSARGDGSCVSGSLPLVLSVDGVGTGLASGQLTLMTESDKADVAPIPVTVTYELEMKRPRNNEVFIPLLVAITAGGILLPVLLLYLMKWWTARIPGSALSIGSARGQVDQGSSFLDSAAITEQGMRAMTLVGTDRRSVPLNGQSRLRTKVGLGLTEPGWTVVEGQYSASSATPSTDRKGRRGRLPLAVQDAWIALLDAANSHAGPVEVVFLVSPVSGRLPDLLADARARLPEVVSQLRSRLGDSATGGGGDGSPQPAANDEWGGTPSRVSTPTAPTGDDWGAAPSTNPRPPAGGGAGSTFDEW